MTMLDCWSLSAEVDFIVARRTYDKFTRGHCFLFAAFNVLLARQSLLCREKRGHKTLWLTAGFA